MLIILAIICIICWFLADKSQKHKFTGLAPILASEGIEMPKSEVTEPKNTISVVDVDQSEPPFTETVAPITIPTLPVEVIPDSQSEEQRQLEAAFADRQEAEDLLKSYDADISLAPPEAFPPERRYLSVAGGSPRPTMMYTYDPKPSRIRQMIGTTAQLKAAHKLHCQKQLYNGPNPPSFPEFICMVTMETIFGKRFPTQWPEFLRSTRSSVLLELDGYCTALALAFEYNGEHHYNGDHPFHKGSKVKFLTQVQNDRFKYAVCRRVGITLLVIPYTVDEDDIPEFIATSLPPEYEPFRLDIAAAAA